MQTASAVVASSIQAPEGCSTSESSKATSTSTRLQHVVMAAVAGLACLVSLGCLFASAFTADPLEVSADCTSPVATETSTTILAFVLGWATCFIAKQHRYLPEILGEVVAAFKQATTTAGASIAASVSASALYVRGRKEWLLDNSKTVGLALVILMFSGCTIGLFASAFDAVPEEEPTDAGFASESSTCMKAFTFGWMFLMFFKLQHELVGKVGLSCLLQPC